MRVRNERKASLFVMMVRRGYAILLAVLLGMMNCHIYAETQEMLPNASDSASEHTMNREVETPETSAQEAEEEDQDGQEEAISSTLTFMIDDSQVYEGMDKAYKNGYTPSAKEGKVVIILPLKAEGKVKGNNITVTPHLGDTSGSPFQYKNYQKTVKLSQEKTASGKIREIYLVRLELKLDKKRENGVYPVELAVTAKDQGGERVEQIFTTYVTITDGKNNEETIAIPEPEPETEPAPQSQPIIIVSSCQVNGAPIEAGNDFTMRVVLKNTSKKISVQNMTVTASSEDSGVSIEDVGGVFYVESLKAGGEAELTLSCHARREAEEGQYHISLNMSYDNPEAVTLTSSGTVAVDIVQPMVVEVLPPVLPESVVAGDTFEMELSVMNLGRSRIYNARFVMDIPGLLPSGDTFVGNLEPGTEGSTVMKVFAGSRNTNSDGTKRELPEGMEDSLYGDTAGTLTLIYEDVSGKEYTQEYDISTVIDPFVMETETFTEEEAENGMEQWGLAMGIVFILIAGLGGFLLLRSREGGK